MSSAPDEGAAGQAAANAAIDYPDDWWYWKYDSPEAEWVEEAAGDEEPVLVADEEGEIVEEGDNEQLTQQAGLC